MGAMLSSMLGWLWGAGDKYPPLGPNPDTRNPVTGMTPRQARAVLVTWDMVRPNMKHHGVHFFIKLFKTYPEAQAQFKPFHNKNPDSLVDSPRMAAHGSTVMNAISSIVDNLGDTAVLAEILKTTGRNHKARGIQKKHFEMISEVLLVYLGEQLGSEWTPAAQEGWRLAMSAVNNVIYASYDE